MLPALLRNTPARVQLYRAGDHQHVVSPQCGWTWSFKNQAQGFVGDVLLAICSIYYAYKLPGQ